MTTHPQPAWSAGKDRPYIIAEAGVNHNGQLDLALQLIDAACSTGTDSVKFQAFSADQLVTRQALKAAYQHTSASPGESQYDMLKRYELTADELAAIQQHCQQRSIDLIVTPFSPQWIPPLDRLNISAFKIGSGNINSLELLQAIGRTTRPVIVSTGMAELPEIEQALDTLRHAGSRDIAVLHCVSLYPTKLKQANLYAVQALQKAFPDLPVGFSDHTEEIITGALAVAAGAVILEKHFTLDKTLPGPDHAMSLVPSELQSYIEKARLAAQVCGLPQKKPLPEEMEIKKAARMSVVAAAFIPAGTVLTAEMLTVKRPGTGIPAHKKHELIGSVALRDISPDQILTSRDIDTDRNH